MNATILLSPYHPQRVQVAEVFMSNRTQTTSGSCVSLILVNNTAITTDLLRYAFAGEESIRIVGCAATMDELRTVLSERTPDVALVGTRGGRQESTALPFLEHTAVVAPTVRQIVIAAEMDREDVVSFFRNGARGLLCGSQTDVSLLIKCIRCVSMGQIWANASQLDLLIRSLSLPRSLKVTNVLGDSLLSNREEQVLHLLADGLSNRELAAALKLSEHTVKNHLFRIFDKLGVSSRMEAVLYAMSQREQRLLSPLAAQSSGTVWERAEPMALRSSTRDQ
jgi:DNA-binding NarL/FixJ family response regulator